MEMTLDLEIHEHIMLAILNKENHDLKKYFHDSMFVCNMPIGCYIPVYIL